MALELSERAVVENTWQLCKRSPCLTYRDMSESLNIGRIKHDWDFWNFMCAPRRKVMATKTFSKIVPVLEGNYVYMMRLCNDCLNTKPCINLQPWSQGLEKFILFVFCPSLTLQCWITQVFVLPFSNIERGNEGADTYSVGITVMTLCF